MAVPIPTGIDFVSARLLGRRSRLAEAERLDELCRLRTIPELVRALYGEAGLRTAVELQRRMIADLARELYEIARWLEGPAGNLVEWLAARSFVENLKVLARGFVTRTPEAEVLAHLVSVPGQPALDSRALLRAESVEAFAELIPLKPPSRCGWPCDRRLRFTTPTRTRSSSSRRWIAATFLSSSPASRPCRVRTARAWRNWRARRSIFST